METTNKKTYFVAHSDEILAIFQEINEGVKQYLPSICDAAAAKAICSDTQGELETLITELITSNVALLRYVISLKLMTLFLSSVFWICWKAISLD